LRPLELQALGLRPEDICDFSVNVNPFGPSQAMVEAIRRAPLHEYPDPTGLRAREALAASQGRKAGEIVLGNGATELLWTFARAFLSPKSTVVLATPCFSEFGAAARAQGARVVEVMALAAQNYDVDVDALLEAVRASGASLVHVAHPSSPLGRPLAPAELRRLAEALAPGLVLLDESFLALSDAQGDRWEAYPRNVLRLRSLTKDHALAGLRVGYMMAPEAVASVLEASRPSWTTSTLAQAAAVASLEDEVFVAECRDKLLACRRALHQELEACGYTPVPSVAPYLVVPVPFPVPDPAPMAVSLPEEGRAAPVREALLRRGLLVRDCASFGLPNHLRLAARPAEDRQKLLNHLKEVCPPCSLPR
jgi:histidinol-phosphate/aromatic aminotransferase/cobyric acid decarboxylase-like protein